MSLDKITSSQETDTGVPKAPRRRSLTWLLPAGLMFGFAVIILWLFGDRLMPAVEVETARVVTLRNATDKPAGSTPPKAAGKGGLLFQASGWIEPDPYITYVPTLMNGTVKSVHVLGGQPVNKGDLIATLVDDDAQLDYNEAKQQIVRMRAVIEAHCKSTDIAKAELLAAKQNIENAKSRLHDAEDNLTRLKSIATGAIPKQEIVQASLKVKQQRAMLAEAEAAIPRIGARLEQIEGERLAMEADFSRLETVRDRAKLALERTRIVSPMTGIILHRHAAPGKKRMLNMDDPKSAMIVEIYDPNKLQARVDVPLNEAAALQIGQQVELISDLLPETILKGTVTRITGEADLQRNTLQVKISIIKPDPRLRPEMLVRAKFFGVSGTASSHTTSSSRLSIYVPETALIDDSKVWVVSPDSRAELRTLELGGETKDGHRLVIKGLMSGEEVILKPHEQLTEGARVRTRTSE